MWFGVVITVMPAIGYLFKTRQKVQQEDSRVTCITSFTFSLYKLFTLSLWFYHVVLVPVFFFSSDFFSRLCWCFADFSSLIHWLALLLLLRTVDVLLIDWRKASRFSSLSHFSSIALRSSSRNCSQNPEASCFTSFCCLMSAWIFSMIPLIGMLLSAEFVDKQDNRLLLLCEEYEIPAQRRGCLSLRDPRSAKYSSISPRGLILTTSVSLLQSK